MPSAIKHLMLKCTKDKKLPFRGLWLGMITKLDSISLAPILNMYVKHDMIGKEFVDCIFFGMIFNGGSELMTTLHTMHLNYTHKILVQMPLVLLVIVHGLLVSKLS